MPRAYVIGSGPNGLTAAIFLAKAGVEVTVLEAQATLGGGTRSAELTLPGFVHDVCSAVHPMAAGSPAFARLRLEEHGLRWIHPDAPLAHPLDDGTAALLERSVEATAAGLGADGFAYHRAVAWLAAHWDEVAEDALAPPHLPRHPLTLARLGRLAGWPASWSARLLFRGLKARALLAGLAGHAILPLDMVGSGAIGWMLGLAGHAVGWPVAAGGSQKIADALAELPALLGRQDRGGPARALPRRASSRRTRSSATSRPANSWRWPATGCRRATVGSSRTSATAPASSSSTGRWPRRSPGRPRSARAPARRGRDRVDAVRGVDRGHGDDQPPRPPAVKSAPHDPLRVVSRPPAPDRQR